MKRLATISSFTLLCFMLMSAGAQAQQIQFDQTLNGRDAFLVTDPGMTDGDVYTVSATLNGNPLPVYETPSGPAVTQITAFTDGVVEFFMFITPPPAGGLVELKATNGSLVLTGSKLYAPTTSLTPTSISLTQTPSSQTYAAVILTAVVSPAPTGGTVTFRNNGINLSIPQPVSSSTGIATLHAEGIPVGILPTTITAEYSGNSSFEGSTSSSFQLTVTPANLTVIGITAQNKVYDAGTSAVLNTTGVTLFGIVGSDAVTASYAGATGSFADKNIGIGKTVNIVGITISGASIANYTLIEPTTTADISPKVLTVAGITASDKVYDGNTGAALNTQGAGLVGVVSKDAVNLPLGPAVGNFDSKNAGANKTVIVTGLQIVGGDAGNYLLAQPSTTASISKVTASVVPAVAGKVYGTSEPALTGSLTGFVGVDNVTATYSRTTGETVVGSPYTISATLSPGALDNNYNITYGTSAFTITPATASVTPNAATKVFGTPDVPLTGTLSGFLPADNVTATYSRIAGETVAASPYTISAILNPAGVLPNYNITYNTANFTITTNTSTTALTSSASTSVYGQPVTFTATVTGSGTPSGTVTFNDGATSLGTGTLSGSGVATFTSSTLSVAGSPHSITAVYGGDGNFAGSTSAAIQQTSTAMALTVGNITAANKVYDGNTNAVLNTAAAALSGVVSGDNVTLNVSNAVGSFNDKNIGTNKPVTVTGLAITGTAAGNYSLTQPATAANITVKNLTVTGITANDKVYDGTTTATLNTSAAALVGVASGDNVTLNTSGATGTFADKEVGTAKTVTIAGLTLSGTDAGNYSLTQPTTTASITAAPVHTGYIAGAGWVPSPLGAWVKTPTFSGREYFAFAVAYSGNNPVTPTGLMEFLLKSKGLFYPTVMKFSSSQFEVLTIFGSQATLTGAGTVDGSGSYGFLLSVIDGQLFTGNKLRIKIWNKNLGNAVVYDNQMGAGDDTSPTGAVTGLIFVSKTGGSSAAADVSMERLIEEEAATEMPTQYELYNAYPNPFNPSTTIKFDLPEATKVRLVVYDMLGREVAVLADGDRPAGQYTLRFDASKLSSGTYIYRLQTGNYVQTRKLVLMK